MTEIAASVMHFARLRALRSLPGPAPAHLCGSAEDAGRALVAVGRPGSPAHALGWSPGSEPVAGDETGVARSSQPTWLLLTFAACLRACWPDPDTHPFPGADATETHILEVLASLGSLSGAGPDGGLGVQRHHKSALRKLRDAALLGPDEKVVRLGPQVALWADSQLVELRAVRDLMPAGKST